MVPRKKTELVRLLEESIRLAKKQQRPSEDSLGNRLRTLDGLDAPDALEVGPEDLAELPAEDDE